MSKQLNMRDTRHSCNIVKERRLLSPQASMPGCLKPLGFSYQGQLMITTPSSVNFIAKGETNGYQVTMPRLMTFL